MSKTTNTIAFDIAQGRWERIQSDESQRVQEEDVMVISRGFKPVKRGTLFGKRPRKHILGKRVSLH